VKPFFIWSALFAFIIGLNNMYTNLIKNMKPFTIF